MTHLGEAKLRRCASAALFGVLTIASLSAVAPAHAAAPSTASTAAPLKPIKHDPPAYPKGAAARGIEGSVSLEFNVDGAGNVVSPRVVKASPPGVFDAAALNALSKWKYEARGNETANLQVNIVFKQE